MIDEAGRNAGEIAYVGDRVDNDVLPALALLPHQVKILPAEGSALLEAPEVDLVLVDGRKELAHARDLCRLIRTTGSDAPVLLVVTEGGLSVVAADWGMDDVLLHTCGPAELEARLRLGVGRLNAQRDADDPEKMVEETRSLVPGRYSLNSDLKAEVKAGRDNTFSFELDGREVAEPARPGRVASRLPVRYGED